MQHLHLSLCGSGFLGIYHLGVAKALLSHGDCFMSKVQKVAGASAGSLIGAVLVCSPDKIQHCKDFTLQLAADIRGKPLGPFTPAYSLISPLRDFIDTHLPDNAHRLANDVLYISITNLSKRRNEVVSEYRSKQDLLECLIASSYIPMYAGLKLPVIDGDRYFDGGMTNNLYVFPDGRTITVSPFCGGQDIAPRDDPGWNVHVHVKRQTFQINRHNFLRGWHALMPPSPDTLLKYHELGFRNAIEFLKKERYFDNG